MTPFDSILIHLVFTISSCVLRLSVQTVTSMEASLVLHSVAVNRAPVIPKATEYTVDLLNSSASTQLMATVALATVEVLHLNLQVSVDVRDIVGANELNSW